MERRRRYHGNVMDLGYPSGSDTYPYLPYSNQLSLYIHSTKCPVILVQQISSYRHDELHNRAFLGPRSSVSKGVIRWCGAGNILSGRWHKVTYVWGAYSTRRSGRSGTHPVQLKRMPKLHTTTPTLSKMQVPARKLCAKTTSGNVVISL